MLTDSKLIIPTPESLLQVANTNIVDNLRRRRDANLDVPSLYRRAYMVAYNTGELPVQFDTVTEET